MVSGHRPEARSLQEARGVNELVRCTHCTLVETGYAIDEQDAVRPLGLPELFPPVPVAVPLGACYAYVVGCLVPEGVCYAVVA